MSIKIFEENYENYGKCLTISNERLVMKVTLEVGPRIIYTSLDGDSNIFFNDLPRAEKREGADMEKVYDKGDVWYIYGGTRLWFSPEEMPLTYYPDNDKVDYTVNGNTVTFTPPVQKVTMMQQTISVTMDDTLPNVKIDYTAQNKGTKPCKYSLWAMSVCDKGGMAIIPQPADKTGLLANRVISVWEYTDMADKRLSWGSDYIAVKQLDEEGISPLKIGVNNTAGKIGFVHGSTLLINSYTPDHKSGEYPDYGVSTEIYTCKKFMEVETLGQLYTYAPGDIHTHTENWSFVGGVTQPAMDKDEIKSFADKYLR
ncbi:MAG: hypothetical protein E7588_08270 [Ruminococcaceae bacterium]|nr:hypothetical protein [Oscillospiraceae bacterium]